MNSIFIYTLNCPETDLVMYVGQSKDPIKRYDIHLASSLNTNPWHISCVNVWIAELFSKGKYPHIKIIGECDFIGKDLMESFWIKYFSSVNPILLNQKLNPSFKDNPYFPNRIIERQPKTYLRLKLPKI